ncbi:MAG: hypothetical protein ACP5VC_03410 [Bryobacteraceae bacterium]
MAIPADTPLTATALATALVSIGLASLVWQRRVARLEKLRRQIAAIRRLSRDVLRAPDEASGAALMEEGLRGILADRSLRVAIGRPESSVKRALLPPYHLRFPLNSEHNQQEFLEIWHSNERGFSPEIREALEDLAQHAATAAEMRSQRAFREQMARTEQLAATGLLLSAVAQDLRGPLEAILRGSRGSNVESLAPAAETALKLVERLAGHGGHGVGRTAVFDLNELLRRLCEFRERSWHLMQMDVRTGFASGPLTVKGPEAMVEEALLGLIVVAEQSQQGGESRRLHLEAAAEDERAVVRLSWPASADALPPPVEEGLAACRNLLRSCGAALEEGRAEGQVQLRAVFRLVGEPADARPRESQRAASRPLTLLLVHPQPEALRPLIRALAERHHRVVPAVDVVQALDMAARLRFDAVFAAPAGTDIEWIDFAERMSQHAPVVGWLSSGGHLGPPGVPMLPLTPGGHELDACLESLEATG